MTDEERSRAAIGRLTENEKLCLRRRLNHQTAKEMAIELGISPHAVEKRLKMARTKLGLSSSLEAARLLAALEARYGATVPQPPELAPAADPGEPFSRAAGVADRPAPPRRMGMGTIAGVISMSLILIAAAASFLAPRPPQAAPPQTAPSTTAVRTARATGPHRKASAAEVRQFLGESFAIMDRDHSGYLESGEMPRVAVRVGAPDSGTPMEQVASPRAEAMWLARNDRDRDGKVSLDEYLAALAPIVETTGVPAKWKPRG